MSVPLSEIPARLLAGASELRLLLPAVLADPRAHRREAMLLAFIAALALMLLVTIGTMFWDAATHLARSTRTGVRVRRRWTGSSVLVPLGIVLLLLVAAVVVPSNATTSDACGWCHATGSATASWRRGDHQTVGCYGCHAGPGVLGALQASAGGAGLRIGRDLAAPGTVVDSRSCLACHADVHQGVVGETIRVQHSDMVLAGLACTECHAGVGHERPKSASPPIVRKQMSRCLVCHDDDTASAECSTCHPERPSDAASAPSGRALQIPVTCDGECHTEQQTERCVACHGLELPHPSGFLAAHAPMSASDPNLCARCHEAASPTLACACHPDGSGHGSYSEWYPRHGDRATTTGPGGCLCHDDKGFAHCRLCHSSSPW